MIIRILHATGVATLLGCLAWLLAAHSDPTLRSAADQLGERWYRLRLDDRHVGYLHTRNRRDAAGRWHFHRDLRFVLNRGQPVRVEEQLSFDGAPPYRLTRAFQRNERPDRLEGTLIQRMGDGYRASDIGAGVEAAPERPVDLAFTLSDYLGFETWLRETAPAPGSTLAARSLDLGRRQVVARQFRVVERNHTGYKLENPAPTDPTHIQLDQHMRPLSMTLSGLFELEQVSRQEALAPRTALQAASYFVPADRVLKDHTTIRTLALKVQGGASAAELWPELAHGDSLTRRAEAVTSERLAGDELSETADHPIFHPRIRAMAADAVSGVSEPAERVAALTRFVHNFVHYRDDGAQRHVLTLLDDPRGDCSEYADLLTTLARSLDIPTRTVFGLAYADERPPAFRFHAWNELLVDGRWQAVDPTWNQLRVDATHIPMPSNVARALQLLTGGLQLSFTVQEVEYF